MVFISRGTAQECRSLWYKPGTSEFFTSRIQRGEADFWTAEEDGVLIGELYAFHQLEDEDFADGQHTAYLCAFRVAPKRRGMGIGTTMLREALADLRTQGFSYATIGVDPKEIANLRLYRRMGFVERIKLCRIDPCDRDMEENPLPSDLFWLLRADLTQL